MSSDEKKMVVSIKCPKCGKVEVHNIDQDDLNEIQLVGISRIGFIHGEHTIIVSFDATGFIRGAYIVSSDRIPSNIRVFYKDYRILNSPQFPVKNFELVIVDTKNKVIDVRLSRLSGGEIATIAKSLEDYSSIIRGALRRIGVSGRMFKIAVKDGRVIYYNNIDSKIINMLIENLEDSYSPYSIYYFISYLKSKDSSEIDDPETTDRAKKLLLAHKHIVRPRKGINAIKYARASILAFWPELTESFDSIVNYLKMHSDKGVTLLKILLKVPKVNIDALFNMLKELRKRDLIEIEPTQN